MNVLFVCTGNTCRSPMAEALMKHKNPAINVKSAGIFAGHHQRANEKAIEALKCLGISTNHHSQPVTEMLIHWADVVLTMTTQHKQSLILQYPNQQDKYFTLKEYVSDKDRKIWHELRKAYQLYEDKRRDFLQKNKTKLTADELEKRVQDHLAHDLAEIQQMENSLINYDISDPFGGELAVYKQTLAELDQYTEQLIKKMNHNN